MRSAPGGGAVRKVAVVSVTAAVGLVCGWSSLGWPDGLVFALAVGAAAAVATFANRPGQRTTCARWWWR